LGCATRAQAASIVYRVYKAGRLVLIFENVPGRLISTAMPMPGAEPVRHPFPSGQAFVPEEEDALRVILEQSLDFEDFSRRLRAAGYVLQTPD